MNKMPIKYRMNWKVETEIPSRPLAFGRGEVRQILYRYLLPFLTFYFFINEIMHIIFKEGGRG